MTVSRQTNKQTNKITMAVSYKTMKEHLIFFVFSEGRKFEWIKLFVRSTCVMAPVTVCNCLSITGGS